MLNVLHADAGDASDADAQALEQAPLIDWPAAARSKLARLRRAFAAMRRPRGPRSLPRGRTATPWSGTPGSRRCTRHIWANDPGRWHWRTWPEAYRDPDSPAVADFARAHADEVAFHAFLQMRAEQGLAAAQAAARAAGMPIGLIADLAVGADGGGSHCWSRQRRDAARPRGRRAARPAQPRGPELGPDRLLARAALRADGFRAFLEMLRASLRHAGGVRIDHAMGLRGSGWSRRAPARRTAPICASRSTTCCGWWRWRATATGRSCSARISAPCRRASTSGCARRGMLGMRVLWFERDEDASFRAPARWTARCGGDDQHARPADGRRLVGRAATSNGASTPRPDARRRTAERRERERDRALLWQAFRASGAALHDAPPPEQGQHAAGSARRAMSAAPPARWRCCRWRTRWRRTEQPNLPGTLRRAPELAAPHPGRGRRACSTIRRSPRRLGGAGPGAPANDRAARDRAAAIPQGLHARRRRCGWCRISPRLGISHLYASPLLKARPGSTHGYDIVDHDQINPELGGEPALRRLVAALRRAGMGLILDIVPNHMGVGGADNAWWLDVLEWGRASPYAEFFDIDWEPPDPALHGRMLAPFLGDPYGEALANGDLAPRIRPRGRALLRLRLRRAPLPDRAARLSAACCRRPATARRLRRAFGRVGRSARSRRAGRPRAREALRAPEQPRRDRRGAGRLRAGDAGGPRRALHRLLERQHYRLAWWRAAADEINWRRFFDINSLAGVRVELPQVFDATHATGAAALCRGPDRRRAHRPCRRAGRPARLLPQAAAAAADRGRTPAGELDDEPADAVGRENPGPARAAARPTG